MREKGHAMASIQTPGRKAATLAGTLILAGCCLLMGLAPVVGVPLPFISYGGTSMLTFLLSIGVVLSLERQVRVEMSRG